MPNIFSMFTKSGREKAKKERFEKQASKVGNLSDSELKYWYTCADTSLQLGHADKYERELLTIIETELERRGFEYQTDF